MSTYKKEFGTGVQNAAGTLSGVVEGQLWYDSTAASFKYQYPNLTINAWATGGNLNTARAYLSGMGTQTAALVTGGWQGSPVADPSGDGQTESYNGSAWTEVNDLNTARSGLGAAGIQTSAVAFGGNTGTIPSSTRNSVTNNESWNGTCWAEVNDLNTGKRNGGRSGVDNTSALAFGGTNNSDTQVAETESWNGTCWAAVNNLNTARGSSGSNGTQTSALYYGGFGPARSAETESWNGTCWTIVNSLGTARYGLRGAGADNTSAVAFGGESAPAGGVQAITEVWNGTSWTEVADLSTARTLPGGNGTATSALASGGLTPSVTNATEEFTGAGQPVGVWSTGGSMNTARISLAGAGTSNTASLAFAGSNPGIPALYAITESYNGSTWTEVNDMVNDRSNLAGAGTQTSALAFGGIDAVSFVGETEEWNGTSWTEVSDLNTARYQLAGAGTQTSAIAIGGYGPTYMTNVETWNGTSWTETTDLANGRFASASFGADSTSALVFGGFDTSPGPGTGPADFLSSAFEWNGSTWTSVNSMNSGRNHLTGTGVVSSGFAIGGEISTPAFTGATEEWNGASWTELADLNTAREILASGGTTSSALAFGGATPTVTAATEEWTKPSFTVKTITSS